MDDERIYWIWLAEALGQGSMYAAPLLKQFGSPRKLEEAGPDAVMPDAELRPEAVTAIRAKLRRASLTVAEDILSRCEYRGITVLTPADPLYPDPLRTLRDLPLVLYVLGKLPDFGTRMRCAVVGTRKMSDYGRRIAYSLGAGLAFGGAVVVSGMALGADSMALIGALDAGGDVAAVLGSGVDVIYPREHTEIYHKILAHGSVISEYPPGTPPVGSHFPVRNRIMSGLSDAAVVVEAGSQSGALITAKRALEQGRKLFAVPGKVGDPGAEGTNDLIRDGALPAIQAEDILSEFEFIYKSVSVDRAHRQLRDLDFERLSLNAMQRTRIGAKGAPASDSVGSRAREVIRDAKAAADEKYREARAKRGVQAPETAVPGKAEEPVSEPVRKPERDRAKENDFAQTLKQTVNSPEKVIPAQKTELDMLDVPERKVYNKMKPNVPTLPDELVDGETDIGTVMSALTVLEMAGAVESGSGGYFMRVTPDDIMQSEND
ncbi:MAG: DNA-processing protein DprA [Clostridiales bacterium]|nr:DNA-processing protein DprA [Clostridiales bacterium]